MVVPPTHIVDESRDVGLLLTIRPLPNDDPRRVPSAMDVSAYDVNTGEMVWSERQEFSGEFLWATSRPDADSGRIGIQTRIPDLRVMRVDYDPRGRAMVEVSETSGPGALKPNIRRVFKTFGDGDSRHKSLVCREVDTNLDGIKDVVRTFNEKGEAMHDEADTDWDGHVDLWINFVDGRMAEEDADTNHDGKPDVWKFYMNGQLQRVRRDRNFDGKPDVWEIYAKGKLERMGVDESYDGHVDRWDRDLIAQAQADEAERKAREAMAAQGDAGAPAKQ